MDWNSSGYSRIISCRATRATGASTDSKKVVFDSSVSDVTRDMVGGSGRDFSKSMQNTVYFSGQLILLVSRLNSKIRALSSTAG